MKKQNVSQPEKEATNYWGKPLFTNFKCDSDAGRKVLI